MMVLTRVLIGAMLIASVSAPALAKTKPPTLRDKQQAACYGDVQRLCADALPSVDRVTACMKPKKALVSDKCRALWDVKG